MIAVPDLLKNAVCWWVCAPLARALDCFRSRNSLHMYLPLKRETGREHKREEGGVARRSQARTDCVCVHAESSCWALSRSALALSFPFSFPLTLSPRRHTDLSSWCKWSVNKTLRHWWYRAAPRWVKVCECADYTLLLPADLKNTFFQAERPKTWMKNSSSIKKSCCRTTQRWPWALVTHHKHRQWN